MAFDLTGGLPIERGDGSLKPARAVQVPWMKRLLVSGEDIPLVLETGDGLVAIKGTTFINCRSRGHSVLPASFPIVQQAHARYCWDGEEATGMIERSTLRAQMGSASGASGEVRMDL